MKKSGGFTLIEVAIVLLIGGILLASSSALLLTYMKKVEINTTEKRLEAIQEAMQLFLNLNGRYPCPANPADGMDTANFGIEQPTGGAACTGPTTAGRTGPVVYGSVPVRSLNLPDDFMADAWGGRFTYAVTRDLAQDGTFDSQQGGISIVDRNGFDVVTSPVAGSAHYAIVSHGENNSGATSLDGQNISACLAAVNEGENCDNDATFRSTLLSSGALNNNYNDDMVAFKAMTSFGEWVPIGAVMAFNLNSCPDGWTEFTDARGRVVIGANGGTYTLGSQGGEENTTLDSTKMSYTDTGPGATILPAALGAGGTVFGRSTLAPPDPFTNIPPYVSLLYCEKGP